MLYATYNLKHVHSKRGSSQRTQRGQSIVIALLVLLLLGLAGALFVTIVARNLINANHANRVTTADQYGRAGIAYADAQLSNSLDGADWRPPLQFALAPAFVPTEARELARYNAQIPPLKPIVQGGLAPTDLNDPDKAYLDAGYSRYNTGAGRFLLRLTYDPVNIAGASVQPGKYIKIESIGREGTIDNIDPTTYTNNRSSDRTQSYQVAYKPLGITDYARFETNPDKRSDIANLGVISEFYAADTDGAIATPGVSDFNDLGSPGTPVVPPTIREYPVLTTYGAADAYNGTLPNPNAGTATTIGTGAAAATAGGGSIHANMPLRFFGKNIIYLNNAGAGAPLSQDSAEVAGDLLLDNYDQKAKLDNSVLDTSGPVTVGQQASLILNPTDITKLTAIPITTTTSPQNIYVAPSNSSGALNGSFDTQGGLIRDGSMQNDPEGLPRGITRLEPPLMDALDSVSQLPRYKALTMNSAPRNNNGTAYPINANGTSPSQYGYGKAIYINNTADIQQDSASIGGSTTLTDEWLHGNSAADAGTGKGNWNGHFYDPPGVSIILGQLITPPANANTAGVFGLRLIRSAGDHWVGPDGTTNAGSVLDATYSDLGSEATNANLDSGDTTKYPDNNIVIYLEGNVRVRGIASPNEGKDNTSANQKYIPRHITIVTNGTAYIEGNLLKGDPDSSITVLAHDYVCVNTTQFLAGPNVGPRTAIVGSDEEAAHITSFNDPLAAPPGTDPTGINALELTDGTSLLQSFGFGFTNPGAATVTTPSSYSTNTKMALYLSAGPPASIGSTQIDLDIFDATGTSVFTLPPIFGTFTHTTFDLGTSLNTATGNDQFHFSAQRDATALQNPLIERAAILPMDIRIEAVLYAQTRSFFVIPGDWFNSDPSDNLDSYQHSVDTADPEGVRPFKAQNAPETARFPLYGQPIDLKITLDGSVSEARPADIAAQSEWMQKWGWIPQYHGTLTAGAAPETSGHNTTTTPTTPTLPTIGLQIIYNPQAGYPYDPTPATGTAHYLRSDKFGRPLPFTPNLPVSTGLIYSGESGEPPLLQ